MKKIFFFIPTLNGGGAERVFINLTREFPNLNFITELIVCSLKGDLTNEVSDISIKSLGNKNVLMSIIPLAIYLYKQKPNVLISGMSHANIAAIISVVLSGSKTKVIVSSHEDIKMRYLTANFKEKFVIKLTRLFYRLADGFIAVSEGVLRSDANYLGNSLPKFNTTIYNPVITNKFNISKKLNISKKKFKKTVKLVAVGRLTYQKDYHTLLKALKIVSQKHNVYLSIYGNGELMQELREFCVELNISHIVEFHGFSNCLSQIYSDKDIFILSSRWEGFGNVIVEALSFGCIVISTKCDYGPSEVLCNGKYGFLFNVGDYKQLAKYVDQAISERISYDIEQSIRPYFVTSVTKKYKDFIELMP